MTSPAVPPDLAAAYGRHPEPVRERLYELRALVLQTAADMPEVGEVEEALRWGEPAFLTTSSKSGSTVRIGGVRDAPDEVALYFNCQTTLVETFRQWYPKSLRFLGNRGIAFHVADPLPVEAVTACVAAALRYHLDRKRRARLGGS